MYLYYLVWELGEAAGPLLIAPLSEAFGRCYVYNIANVLFIGGANIQSVVFVHREQLGLPTYFGLAPSIHLRRRRTHALLKLTKSEYTACVSRRSMWTKTIYWFRNATNYKARNQSTEHLDTDAPELCRLLVTKKAVDR